MKISEFPHTVIAAKSAPSEAIAPTSAAERGYFPELDGIRGVAALMIVWSHLGLPYGHMGVPIFFVLSGFLITILALREEASSGRLHLGAFYVRRCFRILPLYYLLLGLHLSWFLLLHHGRPEEQQFFVNFWPHYVFYTQEFIPVPVLLKVGYGDLFAQTWSLGIEEKFYLVWPALCFIVMRNRQSWRILMTIALLLAFLPAVFTDIGRRAFFGYHQVLIGCLAAQLVRKFAGTKAEAVFHRPGAVAITFVCLVVLQVQAHLTACYLLYGFVFGFLLVALIVSNSLARQLLSGRVMQYLGRISYGLYLVHTIAIRLCHEFGLDAVFHSTRLSALFRLGVVVTISVGIASALHFAFEKPLIGLGRSLAARVRGKRTSSSSGQVVH